MGKSEAKIFIRIMAEDKIKRTSERRCHLQLNADRYYTDPNTGNYCSVRIHRLQQVIDKLYQREERWYGILDDLRAA